MASILSWLQYVEYQYPGNFSSEADVSILRAFVKIPTHCFQPKLKARTDFIVSGSEWSKPEDSKFHWAGASTTKLGRLTKNFMAITTYRLNAICIVETYQPRRTVSPNTHMPLHQVVVHPVGSGNPFICWWIRLTSVQVSLPEVMVTHFQLDSTKSISVWFRSLY